MGLTILPNPHIHLGLHSESLTVDYLKDWHCQKTLILTDPGILNSGIHHILMEALSKAHIQTEVFSEVISDPDINSIEQATKFARNYKPDAIIGLGGGSTLDTAKVVATLCPTSISVASIIGTNLIERAGLPLIAIPTTAGTGSEVTSIAVVSDPDFILKKAVVSPYLIPKVALLDPALTVSLPGQSTAHTGMDALSHAIESYTSLNANAYTEALSLEAIELITNSLPIAYSNPESLEHREAMLKGSLLAGLAFSNAGVAAAHALAYPLGAEFHLPHGLAVSLMLLPVTNFNLPSQPLKFKKMAERLTGRKDASPQDIVSSLKRLMQQLAMPTDLKSLGVPETALNGMAKKAMEVTRLLNNNPRSINQTDAEMLFAQAFVSRETLSH